MSNINRSDEPTAIELASLIRVVRLAQRQYFRDRTPEALMAAKQLERALDQMVRCILEPEPQGSLFRQPPTDEESS